MGSDNSRQLGENAMTTKMKQIETNKVEIRALTEDEQVLVTGGSVGSFIGGAFAPAIAMYEIAIALAIRNAK